MNNQPPRPIAGPRAFPTSGQAVQWFKGRGAVGNPQGRFERLARSSDDAHQQAYERVGGKAHGKAHDLPHAEVRPEDELGAAAAQTEVRSEVAKSIISRNQSEDIFFDQSINPYRGCEHGCIYCYARPQHSFIGLSPGRDFETRLYAKTNAVELLERELNAAGYQCSPINVGSVTDAYQPIERQWQLTRGLVALLARHNHPFSLITKSSLIERDIDLIAPAAAKGLVSAYVTVTTLDSQLATHWEPRAAAPWRRIETIRRLAEAGIPVGVMVAPIVPFINEPEIEQIVAAARQAGARSAHYTVLRLPLELRQIFIDWLRFHYPQRADRVLARLMDLRGGKKLNDSEFFTRMKGSGAWAELIKMRFEMATRKHGLRRDRLAMRTDLFRRPASSSQLSLFDRV